MNIGTQLKNLRKAANLSATDVAKKLGVSKSTISNYEKGIRTPNILMLEEFSKIYDVSIQRLLYGDNFCGADFLRNNIKIPILGTIRAGEPIIAEENILGYTYSDYCNRGDTYFALYVIGDSMNNCRIFEGDTVVVRQQSVVDNGEIAVVRIDDEEATIKKFFRNGDNVTLMPSSTNPAHKPRTLNLSQTRVDVLGKVVEVKIKL